MSPDTAAANPKILQPGATAPDFTLLSSPGQRMSLRDLRGRPVILVFYPADWSPVCGDEVSLFNEILPEFRDYGAELLGISVDGPWCHAAYAREKHLRFPLLSDFEPKGAVSRKYGAYERADGTSSRALFVLDGEGIVRWSFLSPIDVNPGADGVLNALEKMASSGTTTRDRTQTQQDQSAEKRS